MHMLSEASQQDMLWTVGHSTRPFEELVAILKQAGITLLVDVRAKPQSRFYPHFNKKYLMDHVPMKYLWMGDVLGGKNMHLIPPEDFARGIDELIELSKTERICILCSEGKPTPTTYRPEGCHRWNSIAPALREKGMEIIHL